MTGKRSPKVGVLGMAFPGYYLGGEKGEQKYREFLSAIQPLEIDVIDLDYLITDNKEARLAGQFLNNVKIDCIIALLTTFVPDHFLVNLLDECNVPVFLYAVEREIGCISLVGAMLTNPTLYDLGKVYEIGAGEIGDADVISRALVFARTAMLSNVLKNMRVGYMGKNPDIMFSMQADEYGLKKTFGVTVIPLQDFEYEGRKDKISEIETKQDWISLKDQVGVIEVREKDGLDASKLYLAMTRLVKEKSLDAISINCWTRLKSRVCLPVARMNDKGISSGCEGDLHSTILLRLLYALTGKPALNGDFLRLVPEKNQIIFSHCGAGALSLASNTEAIALHASIETKDGIGVFFPVDREGDVTAFNLIGSRAGYRLSVLSGRAVKETSEYEGNPMNIHFEKPVAEILKDAVNHGSGHHWNIVYGNFSEEFRLLCQMKGVEYNLLS